MKKRENRGIQKIKGFTLIELIVVVTILTILGTIGFTSLQGYSNDAKDATKITDLSQINTALSVAIAGEKGFPQSGLKAITYKNYPQDTTVYIGELLGNNIPGLNNTPVDPFTKKPYILGIYTGGNGGLVRYAQVGAVLENKKGDLPLALLNKAYATEQYAPIGVPMQKIVGNYNPQNISGISGLIPRWALENYENFKKTEFYASGSIMYGGTWSMNNNYVFSMDKTPLVQINGYTNTGILLYESFENLKTEITTQPGMLANNYKSYPNCGSNTISIAQGHEINTKLVDQIQTLDCRIDTSVGVNSQSSFYLKWLRDSTGGDGQYNYVIIDPTKKYQYSLDTKGHLDTTVNGGKLRLYFTCLRKNSVGINTTIQSNNFLVTLDTSTFTRISAYVNTPDPSGNGLSIIIPGGITDNTSCIFYRSNAPKSGDELWFDNYIIKEIP